MNDGWCASELRALVGGGRYHHVPYHFSGEGADSPLLHLRDN